MNSKQRWSHFVNGIPGNYRDDLEQLNEVQLRSLHKLFIQNKISGGTSAFVGACTVIPSGGVSALGISIGTRRMAINQERIRMIEAVMRRKGYKGHTKSWKDYALPVTLGLVGMGIGVGGIDAVVGSGIESAVTAPTDLGPTPDITTLDLPSGLEDSFTPDPPPGLDEPITPDLTPDLDDFITPPIDQITPVTPVDVIPPAPLVEIPNVEWVMTDQGIIPAIDGVPMDAFHGQVDPSALYQTPADPGSADAGSYFDWNGDPGVSNLDTIANYDHIPIEPLGFNPTESSPPVLPPEISTLGSLPTDQFDLSMVPTDVLAQSAMSGFEYSPYLLDIPPAGLEEFPLIAEDPSASSTAYGAVSSIAAVAVTHLATHVGSTIVTHAATHAATHATQATPHQYHDLDELFRQSVEKAAEKAAKQAAKKAVKMIWEAVEKELDLPRSAGHVVRSGGIDSANQELISQTPEFEIELKNLLASPEWKQLQEYLRYRRQQNDDDEDKENLSSDKTNSTTSSKNVNDNETKDKMMDKNGSQSRNNKKTGTPRTRLGMITELHSERHQHCLITLVLSGDDLKLANDPDRLRFFIEQADGNILFVRAWIEQYYLQNCSSSSYTSTVTTTMKT